MDLEIPFLKKLALPAFSFRFFKGKPASVAGIDIGASSTKVVQLRYDRERGILETYGELLNKGYLQAGGGGAGFLHYSDNDIATLWKDLLRESNTTARDIISAIPAGSSFITTIPFPPLPKREIEQAIAFEARKYIPIPISEVAIDWEILEPDETREKVEVLLVAVPRDLMEKFRRIAELAGVNLRALEVETFSMVRSLGGQDPMPTAYVNMGHQSTTLSMVDKARLRASHNFGRGSHELTRALELGLGVNRERAEAVKREVGLSERVEERETVSIITPLIEALFAEIERTMALYNRRAPRKIQKMNFTGGGSALRGLIEYAASKFGIEVVRGNPFARVVTPAFLQPVLREIGPSFSVAVGLALREITSR